MTNYGILQKGYYFLGIGNSIEDAVDDANEMAFQGDRFDESVLVPYERAAKGDLCALKITDALYDDIIDNGGAVPFEVDNGIAMTPEEFDGLY